VCGRYNLSESAAAVAQRFHCDPIDMKPRYNQAPGRDAPVLTGSRGGHLEMMHWGMSAQGAAGNRSLLINARAETVFTRKTFKDSIICRRCIVPATGFYEWAATGTHAVKQVYNIHPVELKIFAMAAIWKPVVLADGSIRREFVILTRSSEAEMAGIHARMPVILKCERESEWLSEDVNKEISIRSIIEDSLAGPLLIWPVSSRVNSVVNDDPECLRRVSPGPVQRSLFDIPRADDQR
jgi:putative SOS response-associated peptidase YedK